MTDEVARLEAVERRMKVIEADWDEWFDKYRRLYARLSKRVERDEKALEVDPGGPNGAARPISTNPLAIALLQGRRPE